MKAVIAHSFARIFYRNAFNMGLLLLEIGDDVNKIKDGDKLEVSPEEGVIKNLTTGETIKGDPQPADLKIYAALGDKDHDPLKDPAIDQSLLAPRMRSRCR